MSDLNKEILEAWSDRQDFVVLSTVSEDSIPNSIYIVFASIYDENTILVADNKLFKTKKNILSGCEGAVLFITSERKAYQIKGLLSYETEGKYFDDMKKWNREDLPGHGVAILKIREIFSGAEKLL